MDYGEIVIIYTYFGLEKKYKCPRVMVKSNVKTLNFTIVSNITLYTIFHIMKLGTKS
jgi:hypothetical protein